MGTLALPLNGKRRDGRIIQVYADGRELYELAFDLQSSHPCATEEVSFG
uniref:Chalconeflavonone isomerase isoform X1 n=1 Tax=Rhizophora mucronata TaxID=61149 RepID=A0A2P2JHU0_RHIMU